MEIVPSCWSCPVLTPARKIIGAPGRMCSLPGALHPGAGGVLVGVETFFLRSGPPLRVTWAVAGLSQSLAFRLVCGPSPGMETCTWCAEPAFSRVFLCQGTLPPRSSQLADDDVSSEQKVLVRFWGRGCEAGDGPLSSRTGLGG